MMPIPGSPDELATFARLQATLPSLFHRVTAEILSLSKRQLEHGTTQVVEQD